MTVNIFVQLLKRDVPNPPILQLQYGSVKARDAINRRLYKGLIIVKTAICDLGRVIKKP
ncbi:MAG: hypothetical protein V7L01_01205 [Nostoc sp.]|uniref:hypothetical protein n=1 Tax=Nostoc sp. TaxID=1180 RepID=UPI002FF96103